MKYDENNRYIFRCNTIITEIHIDVQLVRSDIVKIGFFLYNYWAKLYLFLFEAQIYFCSNSKKIIQNVNFNNQTYTAQIYKHLSKNEHI